MKQIPLTKGYVALVDDEDYERVSQYSWSVKQSPHTNYAHKGRCAGLYGNKVAGESTSLHRFILGAPAGYLVDHVDGNGLNNTRGNLRICTKADNARNRRKTTGMSPFKGLFWSAQRRKWRVKLRLNGKVCYAGSYDTEEEAARAYDVKAKELFGDFARLNFP